ncbi:response regulator [Oscillatoria sp. FACHB-1406]|uniref:response regulator n=1 Tax=Oscillatoria sp. FACHB-1406 TaxID=2692846 RepID=UPI00168478EA|nr:response regulator [Oscillatoria sp. FACHB-1406]MBD2576454.1 response regulator [Oscillatoria sp. FACHB-1406]
MSLKAIKQFATRGVGRIPLNAFLVVPFIVQIAGIVSVVGYLSFKSGQNAVNDLAAQLRQQISDRTEQKLDAYLSIPRQLNQINVDAVELGLLKLNDFTTTGRYFLKQMQAFEIGYNNFGNIKGEFIGVERLNSGKLLINEVSESKQLGKLYVYTTDAKGNRTRLKEIKNYDPRSEAWFSDTFKAGKPTWSPIYEWEDKPEILSVSYNYPLYDRERKFIGVIGIDLILSQIGEFLRTLKISPSAKTFIIERDGFLVATSASEAPYTLKNGNATRIKASQGQDRLMRETARFLERKYGNLQQIQKARFLDFKLEGERQFVQVTPWQDKFGLDWLIVVVVPEADFMGQINNNIRTTIVLCLAALGVAVVVGILTARWIILPILRLKDAAIALSQGNFDSIVPLNRKDELGILANAFNSMAQQLQASFATLETQNAELQRLDKLKDEFLANTSHELRTPLNGIIGLAESLVDGATGELPDTTKANLNTIIASGRRLANLVNDLLDFSRLRHKHIELQLTAVGLREIVDLVLTFCQTQVGQKSLQLINAIDPETPLVLADENRLQQILYNLVGNAIKFTESGIVEVSAQLVFPEPPPSDDERLFATTGNLAISVKDTGIGIPEDRYEKIFESFEQADGSTAREYGGTGLGLAVTQKLVELHGGEIHLTSQVGVGSEFVFTLPLARSADSKLQRWEDRERNRSLSLKDLRQAQDLQATKSTAQMIAKLSDRCPLILTDNKPKVNSQFRILIVDDEPVNLQVLANHLLLENYAIAQATNGFEALEILNRGFKPDLILLDVMMPRMTGYEVCQKIRESFPALELPIVMLTAKNQTEDLVQAFNLGANDYLTKPFVKKELLARIKTHISLSKINAAYGRFVPHDFLKFLGKESIIDVELGDHTYKEMTILFSDIRSFTTLSEQMSPEDNFNFINSYLKRVSPVIRNRNGFIDKYIGDAIMALFPRCADDAVKGAIEMQEQIRLYNAHREMQGYVPISSGMGLHTGDMMLGTIGEEQRMESTVISDAVNLASRLESLTKPYGAKILISQETLYSLADMEKFHYRFLDRVRVKGKNQAIAIFEIFDGDPEEVRALKLQTKSEFERAIVYYYQQQLEPAEQIFQEILRLNPEDRAAALYLTRCTQNPDSLPIEGELGTEILTSNYSVTLGE